MVVITKATLKDSEGWKKVQKLNIKTEDIEVDRKRIKEEYNCETVLFTYEETE